NFPHFSVPSRPSLIAQCKQFISKLSFPANDALRRCPCLPACLPVGTGHPSCSRPSLPLHQHQISMPSRIGRSFTCLGHHHRQSVHYLAILFSHFSSANGRPFFSISLLLLSNVITAAYLRVALSAVLVMVEGEKLFSSFFEPFACKCTVSVPV